MNVDDLQDFINCFNPDDRHVRKATERFRFYSYEELMARDKANLDLFWLKDDSLDIIDHLQAALMAFREVAAALPASGKHLSRQPPPPA